MLSWKILTDVARACALMMFISVSAWNCAAVNPHTTAPDAAEAEAFMSRVNEEAKRLMVEVERAHWVYSNFITLDTQEIAAEADERWMAWLSKTIKDATRYDGMEHPQALSRQFQILKQGVTLPAPGDPALRSELAGITSSLSAAYGKGVYCPVQGGALRTALETVEANSESLACDAGRGGVPLGTLTRFMATSRDAAALKEAWVGWRKISIPMRGDFARYVALGNQGAQEIGFADLGELWRSGYDMPPEAFRLEAERLWEQLKPFYEELHCYVRLKLADAYGANVVPSGGPIPAHLLGNMWSQTWGNIYDMVEPFPAEASLDVTKTLEAQGYDEVRMVKLAEGFFTSLGLDPLPETFYERSLLKKPRDRDVQCHASAWDVHYNNDLRIKMCIEITEEELQVVHHELGHNYYYHYYYELPILFQRGANDGFHEAIGDAVALSITPGYLKNVGLLEEVAEGDQAALNFLMKMALDKVAFLPFGKLMDQWRWDVFAGKITPEQYSAAWWDLRERYQGITPPVPRTEEDFDPGAKYHIPANVPYTRYFLAFIYQFQFQRALCRTAGHQGPLHTCSIYGNKAAGEKLRSLLAMGASQPWQDALEAMSGEREGDANALLDYFAPLRTWLQEKLEGASCGW